MDIKTKIYRALVATVVFIIVIIVLSPSFEITALQIAATYIGWIGWISFADYPWCKDIPLCVLVLNVIVTNL